MSHRYSIITAAYNVAEYLDAFIASVDEQCERVSGVQVIAVDDGSTDDTLARLQAWSERQPAIVTVMSLSHGGQGGARNAAIELADAPWVTFIDPDDWMGRDYLMNVDRFLTANPDVALAATFRVVAHEKSGMYADDHPLRVLFAETDRAVDTATHPDYFWNSAATAFFRRDVLVSAGVRFDTRIQPTFEDCHFCGSYLLEFEAPKIGYVTSATYFYRRRANGTSALQRSVADARRFTLVPRLGHLRLVERAVETYGCLPGWLQSMLVYDLSWYFVAEDEHRPEPGVGDVAAEFVRLLHSIMRPFDADAIERFAVVPMRDEWRQVLIALGRGDGPERPAAAITEVAASVDYFGTRFEVLPLSAPPRPALRGPRRRRRDRSTAVAFPGGSVSRRVVAWIGSDTVGAPRVHQSVSGVARRVRTRRLEHHSPVTPDEADQTGGPGATA